jgi:hypothetical protein
VIQYDFDGLVAFRHAGQLTQIRDFAQKNKAARLEITGFRAASLLSNDAVLAERDDIGRRRAEQIASLLQDADLKSPAYDVRWRDAAQPDGVNDATLRRVEVVVR